MALVVTSLLLTGAAFMLIASIGLLRLPDLFLRMHAATKAGTLGKICLVAAVMLHFADLGVAARAFLIVLFFFSTAPLSAHLIARAAHTSGVPLFRKTFVDERDAPHEFSDQPKQ